MNRKVVARIIHALAGLAGVCFGQDFVALPNPADAPRQQLTRYLNGIGFRLLEERGRAVAQVQTREAMERRKKDVREKVLRLIGGLPDYRGPLHSRQVGVIDHEKYRIEKIVFESLPGFYVTGNVYVPKGNGPFPAILNPVGHSVSGKAGEREVAVGLAMQGFVVLKYDPVGQGERLQYYDPDLRRSKVGGPVLEHSHANGHLLLVGDNLARYHVWDGMRGIDYLLTRNDVDSARIGCTGCSGGGTITTYVAALDDRVKVAAPACYMNSWRALLSGPGPQDAEQSFPRFLSEGLDIADYVELFAPKPWLLVSTIDDMFPLEGARQTYEEARRIYALYGAEDRLAWHIGPGPHGIPQPSLEAIYAWFIQWLKDGQGDRRESLDDLDVLEDLLCTPTGQVSSSLGGETVLTLTAKRLEELAPPKQPIATATDLDRLRRRLAADIRAIAATDVQPGGSPPPVEVHQRIEREGYRIELVSYRPEKGVRVPGMLMLPDSPGPKPAVLAADARPKQLTAAPGGDFEGLVKAGNLVFVIQPRGVPETPSAMAGFDIIDEQQIVEAWADVVGRTLVGMRAEDIIRAVDYLSSRQDVDRTRIAGFGRGVLGVPMLHAAVLDERIARLVLVDTLPTYRTAFDRPLQRILYEVGIPGVLKKYDLDELIAALSPRPVTVIDPSDAFGDRIRPEEFRKLCRYAFDTDAKLGRPELLTVVRSAPRIGLIRYLHLSETGGGVRKSP